MLNIPSFQDKSLKGEILLPPSKSISHRYLIIQALSNSPAELRHISDCNDTRVLQKALQSKESEIDFEDAGTPMRFYLAYAALKNLKVTITGNEGLKKRPVGPLVDALLQLGCKVEYLGNKGFLPLKLTEGINTSKNKVTVDASISSQFISALLLIGPALDTGLIIELSGETTSGPYIAMTMDCMKNAGVVVTENDANYKVPAGTYALKGPVDVEADWSASSFFYALAAVSKKAELFLPALNLNSMQGDRVATYIFEFLGVQTKVEEKGIRLLKAGYHVPRIKIDFRSMPDMFPALVATCACLGVNATFIGIRNLTLKESDRVQAMKTNLLQTGAVLNIESDDQASLTYVEGVNGSYSFKSFDDHRIAMACSIFASQKDIEIDDEKVVVKSFPDYWQMFKQLNILN